MSNKKMENKSDILILEKLAENQINYFSITIFKDLKPIVSHCNHAEWLNFYRKNYDSDRPPPVQKYICSSTLRLLPWDLNDINKEAKDFIQKRNQVVEAASNLTVLFKKPPYLTAITLGTKQKNSHLINFLNEDLECLLLIERNLFYKTI